MNGEFSRWHSIKSDIDSCSRKSSLNTKPASVWICYVGRNIGSEINGKGNKFTRPVLVIARVSKNTFLGLPITSKYHEVFRIPVNLFGGKSFAVLNQIKTFDTLRLIRFCAEIKTEEFQKIITSLIDLIKQKHPNQ